MTQNIDYLGFILSARKKKRRCNNHHKSFNVRECGKEFYANCSAAISDIYSSLSKESFGSSSVPPVLLYSYQQWVHMQRTSPDYDKVVHAFILYKQSYVLKTVYTCPFLSHIT